MPKGGNRKANIGTIVLVVASIGLLIFTGAYAWKVAASTSEVHPGDCRTLLAHSAPVYRRTIILSRQSALASRCHGSASSSRVVCPKPCVRREADRLVLRAGPRNGFKRCCGIRFTKEFVVCSRSFRSCMASENGPRKARAVWRHTGFVGCRDRI